MSDTFLTPPQVAEQLSVNDCKVRQWISRGELKATDVGDATRPRWRISAADLREFLDRRSNFGGGQVEQRSRSARKRPSGAVKEWV